MTRSFNITSKITEQHLIVHIDKSVITNNKKCARRFVLLKLTTDRHEASHGLFAIAELLVDLERSTVEKSTVKVKDTKMPKLFFGRKSVANGPIYFA